MSNPNIKRNVRNLSAVALATLGIAAVGEGVKSGTSHPKPPVAPLVEFNQIQDLADGTDVRIKAGVASADPSDSVESATFKLADPKKLPKGVKISDIESKPLQPFAMNSGVDSNGTVAFQNRGTMQDISATLTAPSNLNINGEIPIEVAAVESDGKTHVGIVEVPYVGQPKRPS